jgi:toxin CptA
MHSAPSVSYPVGRSRYATRLLVAVWIAGVCCVGLACYLSDHLGWSAALLAGSTVLAGVAAFVSSGRVPATELAFDGQRWSISGKQARQAADAVVVLDFQALLLVRLDMPRAAACWLWLERPSNPARWQDLRRALHSRPLAAANNVGQGMS